MADDSALQNALLNLGINASHAMEKGGDLTTFEKTLKNFQLVE